ncbi:MAG TPA: hypothetical protein VMV48_14230 [Gallionellaceae bacterium]|nr:hypothetical protein [Gallionellaceae bacterium]
MITPVVLHEDAFYEYFKPYRHQEARHDIWGGLGLETFGKDIETVRKLDDSYVWTVLDGDSSNDQWIVPGIHFVNRICYLVTEKSHRGLDVEFRIPSRLNSLTSIGLKRQMNKITHLVKENQQA